MTYKRLLKSYYDKNEQLDYGFLSEDDIKAQTKGFKEFVPGVFIRKNCNYFYMTTEEVNR